MLAFGRIKRQAEEWESFIVKIEKDFIYVLIGGLVTEEAEVSCLHAGQPVLLIGGA